MEKTIYFAYSVHKTYERAKDALEDYFANGEICEGERPFIQVKQDHRGRLQYYAVMFPG